MQNCLSSPNVSIGDMVFQAVRTRFPLRIAAGMTELGLLQEPQRTMKIIPPGPPLLKGGIKNPPGEDIFGFIGSIFTDEKEDIDTRQSAGNVLLDFKREEYRESLLLFANKEKESKEKNVFYNAAFFKSDVMEALTTETKDLWLYTSEWLDFYAEENIRKRQERWRKEAKAQSQKEEEKDSVSIPFVHTTPKVGRNEPCPCGSGKKYKKCCGVSH